MLRKTHIAVGVAAGLAVLQPSTIQELLVGVGAATVGSVISDIDVDTSKSHREANRVIAIVCITVALVVAVEEIWHIGIYDRLMQNSNILRMIAGIAGFLVLSAFGKVQPHRSFMHSIVALFLMSWCVHIFFPPAMPYFAVGFASHLAIDLLNKKREQLFWPVKKGISFGVCSASGTVNQIMMVIGSLCAAGLFLYLLWHCCFPG